MAITDQFFGSNVGGLRWIELIPLADIISENENGSITTNSSFQIYFTPETARYSERQRRNAQGTAYQAQLGLVVPKIRPEIIDWISQYSAGYWVAIIKDSNGLYRKVGNTDRPLASESNLNTGRNYTNRNEVQISFETNLITPAPEWDAQNNIVQTLISTMISYESFSFDLVADTPYTINLPSDMNVSTIIQPGLLLSSGELSQAEYNSDPVAGTFTITSEVDASNVKLNLIARKK